MSQCPFPVEADRTGIEGATVVLRVQVDASGMPVGADVVDDPGYGFGRAGAECAMKARYAPAMDADGHAIAGTTGLFRLTYSHEPPNPTRTTDAGR